MLLVNLLIQFPLSLFGFNFFLLHIELGRLFGLFFINYLFLLLSLEKFTIIFFYLEGHFGLFTFWAFLGKWSQYILFRFWITTIRSRKWAIKVKNLCLRFQGILYYLGHLIIIDNWLRIKILMVLNAYVQMQLFLFPFTAEHLLNESNVSAFLFKMSCQMISTFWTWGWWR